MSENERNDNVNHPKHYEGSTSFECIDIMRMLFGAECVSIYCIINAFKYMWRYKNKNGLEDVRKAEWYLKYASHLGLMTNDKGMYRVYGMLFEMVKEILNQ